MHLDAGGVQRHGFDLDAHHLGLLKFLEHAVQHASLGPAVHACVDGVPVAEALGQSTPFAAVLGHEEDCIQDLQVAQADVAALRG